MIKAIFLDIGGVIILNQTEQVYLDWAKKLNIPVDDLRLKMKSLNDQRMKGIGEKSRFISNEQLLDFQNDLWETEFVNHELLDFIEKNRDKFTFGIITNNFKEAEEVLLKKFKVPKFYTIFVSSHDIKVLKPNKEIYEYALSKVNLPSSECLFIDDSLDNIKGAEECGIKAIQFTDNESLQNQLKKVLV